MSEQKKWIVLDEEKKAIQKLYERRLALENLLKVIDPQNEAMYQKLISDYGATVRQFQDWWNSMKIKYSWGDGNFAINFETNEVSEQLQNI